MFTSERRSIDKKDEDREGSSGSWRSWSSTGTVLMVGGLVLSSENSNDQGESGAERSELRDGQGRFSCKAKLGKRRSGHQRTQGIREWRAKRELEFEENNPTANFIPVETRASKVRVRFDADSFLDRVFHVNKRTTYLSPYTVALSNSSSSQQHCSHLSSIST